MEPILPSGSPAGNRSPQKVRVVFSYQSPIDPLRTPEPSDGKVKSGGGTITFKRLLLETAIVLAIALPLALGLHTFVTQVYAISGHSMEPTLHDGERVVINKLHPGIKDIAIGDLVIFTSNQDSRKNLVKRVIGLAGDEIELKGSQVLRNGEVLEETYIHRALYPEKPGEVITVPSDHIFVLGDNRSQSQDSRHFGPIPLESVKGRVFLRLWPIDSLTSF